MTANRSMLDNLDNGSGKVMAANDGLMDIIASGTAEIWPQCSGGKDSVTVSEVQLIPSIATNLLSVSKIVEKGYTMSFTNRGGEVFNSDGDLVETGSNVNNQFKLEKIPKQKLTGFGEETKGYRLYDPKQKTTLISREVIFLDEESPNAAM
ncbi:hypothetical protein pipiens_011453 [Culex pipiens pipiens]|uniref:Uncharacterized protein n=1 Tax=Culex pipiens pipiens TaxID=38569 RepID=A0ABD1D714_CULPP